MYGRKAGSVAGFTYSAGLKNSGRDVERCDAGEVAERSGYGGAGQQYELSVFRRRRSGGTVIAYFKEQGLTEGAREIGCRNG